MLPLSYAAMPAALSGVISWRWRSVASTYQIVIGDGMAAYRHGVSISAKSSSTRNENDGIGNVYVSVLYLYAKKISAYVVDKQ